ncbi:hypothetical protein [Cellulomonas sp. PhB143]|uniref:hypothetical protein n=1 Tax=Cellulomonas sp. PhB143 TaxID=2485186 RepID=UPI000FB1DB99|nr:hypothetical protein [Cellulomonas sp. PhB143]ROS74342.1 hypothetical protein EDF32_2083 [Cellulomonas sp. PhB143]
MPARTIDTTPLSARPSRAAVAQLETDARAGDYGLATRDAARADRRAGGCFAALVGGGIAFCLILSVPLSRDLANLPIVLGLLAADVVLWVVLVVVGRAVMRRRWRERARVVALAQANGLVVEPVAAPGEPPATWFALGRSGTTTDRVTWVQGTGSGQAPVEVATYGRTQVGPREQSCRYLVVRLASAGQDGPLLPRVALLAAGRTHAYRGTIEPPVIGTRSGVEVHGDPRDAAQLADGSPAGELVDAVAPHLVAAPALAAELVGGDLVVYAFGTDHALDPALWERFARIADVATGAAVAGR